MKKTYAHVFSITDTSVPYWSVLVVKNPFEMYKNFGFMLMLFALNSAHCNGKFKEAGTYRIEVRGMKYRVSRLV